jgi:PD-(D/E)XK nuclease superfamily
VIATADEFRTGIQGLDGVWPALPTLWSYSSLRDAEECPRRWALSRATYPAIWDRPGYPPRPILPALLGDIVHRSLDLILRRLYEAGCESIADASAVDVLRALGGYSGLAERLIGEQMDSLQSNPRMADQVSGLRSALKARIPAIRQRVQALLVRATLVPRELAGEAAADAVPASGRAPLSTGSHPEVTLHAPQLRVAGRADLITLGPGSCSIVDYKTGAPDDHHADQLRLYALLWARDIELNPEAMPATSLTLSYATHDERVEPPEPHALELLTQQLTDRIAATEGELMLRPPPARPSPTTCRLCSVRQLCDDYWGSAAIDAALTPQGFGDREGTVISQNGPRSWVIEVESVRRSLLRTPTEDPGFRVGDRVRLLGAALARDDDSGDETITLTRTSEVFQLADGV